VNYRLSTATRIVSTKSITAFWGDLKYLQMPQVAIMDKAAETVSMSPSMAIEVDCDLTPGIYNLQFGNAGLVSNRSLINR
jgi:hypothetical protein